jgi:arylsulfatase A-like enzyme
MKLIPRDLYFQFRRNYYLRIIERPIATIIQLGINYLNYITYTLFPQNHNKYLQAKIKKNRSYARTLNNPDFYLSFSSGILEIDIDKLTRPCAILEENQSECIQIEVDKNDYLYLGAAPFIYDFDIPKVSAWNLDVSITNQKKLIDLSIPFNKHTKYASYHPNNNWVDGFLDLSKYEGKKIDLNFEFTLDHKKKTKLNPKLLIASPQILKKVTPENKKNIILISLESMTDFLYLKNNYQLPELPNVDALIDDSLVFKNCYSSTESTLPFSSSIFSGLLSSQHTIGNYKSIPEDFNKYTLNKNITLLQEHLKSCGYLTFCGGLHARFNPKYGLARGFDVYDYRVNNMAEHQMGFDWLSQKIDFSSDFNAFYFMHLDYIHSPFFNFQKSKTNPSLNFDILCSEDRLEIYKTQLLHFDHELGKFINYLKFKNEYDNSSIIITGDHGNDLNWVKHSDFALYEERTRVPLIYKPGISNQPYLQKSDRCISISEIHKIIYNITDSKLPEYLIDLPQYSSEFDGYTISETIMNPKHNYQKHNIAITHQNFKYVCWNEIDWKSSQQISKLDDKLYKFNDQLEQYDETIDVSKTYPTELKEFQKKTSQIILKNLNFCKQYPAQLY